MYNCNGLSARGAAGDAKDGTADPESIEGDESGGWSREDVLIYESSDDSTLPPDASVT
jgi:hypothetical protein